MSDETNDQTETPEEQAPVAAEETAAEAVVDAPPAAEAPADEAPAADAAPVAEATPEPDPAPEAEAAPEPAPATEAELAAEPEAEATPEPEPAAAAPAEPAEPEEQLSSKERRRRDRSTHREARPARTPEERHDARGAERDAKAKARSRRRGQEREKSRAAGPKGEGTPPAAHEPGSPQARQGIVVSDKTDKTITVRIDMAKRHRRYQKIVRSSKRLAVHDERNDAREGDVVRVIECRPMSRTKRWRLVEILERAK